MEWHREIKMYCQWAFTFEPIFTFEETVRVIFKWPYGTSWWPYGTGWKALADLEIYLFLF